VEAAIRGMKDGTINPEDVKVAGIESAEEKAEAEVTEHNYYFILLRTIRIRFSDFSNLAYFLAE
jgi:hypothetical protein